VKDRASDTRRVTPSAELAATIADLMLQYADETHNHRAQAHTWQEMKKVLAKYRVALRREEKEARTRSRKGML
jgi:hypothetical protein